MKRRWEAPESFKTVEEVIKSKPLAEWMEWLEDKDFCIAKVNTKTEAVEQITRENPRLWHGLTSPRRPCSSDWSSSSSVHHPVNIADFEEASVLGGDTAEYLKKVGADDETIARLKAEGGIRLGDDIVPEEDRAPVAPVE